MSSLDRFNHIPMQHRFSMYMSIPLPLTSSPLPPPTMLAYIDMHQADCFIQLLVYNSPPSTDFYLSITIMMVIVRMCVQLATLPPMNLVFHALSFHHYAWLHQAINLLSL